MRAMSGSHLRKVGALHAAPNDEGPNADEDSRKMDYGQRLIASPVREFLPLRALVFFTVKVPKLGRVNFPSFFIVFTIASITSAATLLAAPPEISAEF